MTARSTATTSSPTRSSGCRRRSATRGCSSCHFHLSGIAYTPKGEKEHLPLNEADLHYRELLQAFVDFKVGGTVAVEAPMPFHTADALTFQATYRRLVDQTYPLEKAG